VVRIPNLTRRSDEVTAARDENRDGRLDELDDAVVQDREDIREDETIREDDELDRREPRDRQYDGSVYRANGRASVVDREPDTDADRVVEPVPAPVHRPRASGMATIGLILGVLAAAAVATGVLAKAGIAVGVLGALISLGGVAGTRRAHVTGRFDALLGVLFSLGAVIVGLLALGNAIPWPDTDTNQVNRLVDWLNAQLPWLNRV